MGNGNAAKGSRKLFVSDLHIGSDRRTSSETTCDYLWFSGEDIKQFSKFLDYLNKDGNIDEVILLGDVMDTWVYPIDETPPTYKEIFKDNKNKAVFDSLNALAANERIKVTYMPGNHDMTITEGEVKEYFPKMAWKEKSYNGDGSTDGRLFLAEHGHAYAMFNAPDATNDPIDKLPLGYFIARIVATKVARTGERRFHYTEDVEAIFKSLGMHETFPLRVLDAVAADARLHDTATITINNGKTITIKEVRNKYAKLLKDWKKTSPITPHKAIEGELSRLDDIAKDLTQSGGPRIVIFGHTHDAKLHDIIHTMYYGIYANCGTWCKGQHDKPYSFVIAETQPKLVNVQLCHWDPDKADISIDENRSIDVKTQ